MMKKEDKMMMTISKALETWRKDLNEDDSVTLNIFEKITSVQFKFCLILGVPLLTILSLFI